MTYYIDYEGGSEITVQADSEAEAYEKGRNMYGSITRPIVRVWHA